MNERVNEGWVIISSVKVGQYEFVLGYDKDNPCTPYVTWECNQLRGYYSYYWGHYFKTEKEAILDLTDRVRREVA